MRDEFKASMYFLLACAFAVCVYVLSVGLMAWWQVPAINLTVLSIICLLFMVQSLGVKWSIFTNTKFLLGLCVVNVGLVIAMCVIHEL